VTNWQKFLDSLASNGGTVFLLTLLTLISFVLVFLGMPKGEEIMWLVAGALLGLLKGEGFRKKEDHHD
jgi:hypothetical protein